MAQENIDRRRAPRFRAELASRTVVFLKRTSAHRDEYPEISCSAYTRDISESGIALIISSKSIDESYLQGGHYTLQIFLNLPGASVHINALPVRYQVVREGETERGYLIGARITSMDDTDSAHYALYLASLASGVSTEPEL